MGGEDGPRLTKDKKWPSATAMGHMAAGCGREADHRSDVLTVVIDRERQVECCHPCVRKWRQALTMMMSSTGAGRAGATPPPAPTCS